MGIKYRHEIDGLRAIAVIAVILYHAKITILGHEAFKGGFIGVDIFFVVSGYLITSIILRELVNTGTFSFKYFYERRIRRILPPLLFVILVTLPFALIYLIPTSFVDYSKSILNSLGFTSNIYFWNSREAYGAEISMLKPFLHTWSLSIEEQFYILFPITLYITFKHFKRYLGFYFVTGFIISLILANSLSTSHPSFNFYILPTRGWEFLAGSMLAYFEIIYGWGRHNKNYKLLNSILPSIGLLLIVHSFLFFDDKILHPSFYTLSPIIGTCFIIWFSKKNEITTKILSSKLFVKIGLISYSLYLFHYPVFTFARISNFADDDLLKKILLVLLTILISIISYYFIEQPARNKNYKFRLILNKLFLSILIITSCCFFIIYKDGKLNNYTTDLANNIPSSPLFSDECKYSTENTEFINDDFFKNKFGLCKDKFGPFILIIGDSHSVDLFNAISKVSNKDEFIIGLNRGNCRPVNRVSSCQYSNALKFIKQNNSQIKYIFFTHKGSYFLTSTNPKNELGNPLFRQLPIDELQLKNTIEYIRSIKDINNKIIFIGPHLEPRIFFDYANLKKIYQDKKPLLDNTNYDLLVVDKKLKEISKKYEIEYISKIDTINYHFEKDFIVNSFLNFSDTDHWSESGEIYFGKKLIFNSRIKEILFP